MKRLKSILAVALVALGVGAVAPSIASAHLGDWYTQQQRTKTFAVQVGQGIQSSDPKFVYSHVTYLTSGPYGEHSRYFIWKIRGVYSGSHMTCEVEARIDHNYYIFNGIHLGCYWGWS